MPDSRIPPGGVASCGATALETGPAPVTDSCASARRTPANGTRRVTDGFRSWVTERTARPAAGCVGSRKRSRRLGERCGRRDDRESRPSPDLPALLTSASVTGENHASFSRSSGTVVLTTRSANDVFTANTTAWRSRAA